MWVFMRVELLVGIHAWLIIYIIDVLLKCLTSLVYVCMCLLTQFSERTVCWFCSQVSSGCLAAARDGDTSHSVLFIVVF